MIMSFCNSKHAAFQIYLRCSGKCDDWLIACLQWIDFRPTCPSAEIPNLRH
jgi:hypothetical protein